jgi:hypothetical protein
MMQRNKLFALASVFYLVLLISPPTLGTVMPTSQTLGPASFAKASVRPDAYLYYNWAGYAVNSTANSVTQAKGSWIQPTVYCNSSANALQWVVFWVGIDGLNDPTVEQAGTYGYCPLGSSKATYAAWYEYYPAQNIIVVPTVKVHPGDKFQATVRYSSVTGKISVALTDISTGAHFKKFNPAGFTFNRASAECITETPTVSGAYALLANFGTVRWGKDYTGIKKSCYATINGSSKPIGSFGSDSWQLNMCNYPSCTVLMATTSNISVDGTSFKVTWLNAGP